MLLELFEAEASGSDLWSWRGLGSGQRGQQLEPAQWEPQRQRPGGIARGDCDATATPQGGRGPQRQLAECQNVNNTSTLRHFPLSNQLSFPIPLLSLST